MGYSVNPIQLISMIKNGANPQQLILSMMENNMKNTPLGDNLINLARDDKGAEIETFARNFTAQRGVDFDEAFSAFKKQLGFK